MTGEKFAEIVTKRANERAQEKIRIFEKKIKSALTELTGTYLLYLSGEDKYKNDGRDDSANRIILERMLEASDVCFKSGWPSLIWRAEEKAVTEELLSMMDEMQKALLAKAPNEDDFKPDKA